MKTEKRYMMIRTVHEHYQVYASSMKEAKEKFLTYEGGPSKVLVQREKWVKEAQK